MFVPNPEVIHENRLRAMARNARNGIKDIYLHWTAGYYGQDYDDYHLCIDKDYCVLVNDTRLSSYYSYGSYGNIAK